MPAIEASERAELVAVAARGGPVPRRWMPVAVDDYDSVIDHPDVEVVYIPLPNDVHRHWAERAAAAGKHVLCEKPLASKVDDARAMYAACDRAGVLLAEAWMTPFDPRWAHARSLVDDGLIGAVVAIDTAFTFTIGDDETDNYRWQPAHGGGALLDVGIYCLGPAVAAWGPEPVTVVAHAEQSRTGVDVTTTAALTWAGGRTAGIDCSFVDAERQRIEFRGTTGSLLLDGDAHTGGVDARTIIHQHHDGSSTTIDVISDDPYRLMVEAFADAVRATMEWPRPKEETTDMIALIERIARNARGTATS